MPPLVRKQAPFAWRAALDGDAAPSSVYRVPIPLQVYETAERADLGDLRVLSAQGEVMPYAWLPAQGDADSVKDVAVTVLPMLGAAKQDVSRPLPIEATAKDGKLQSVTVDGAAGRGKVEIGSVFDVSALSGEVLALVFDDYETDTQIHAFSLEASDDMKTWRTLRQEAHIVRLAGQGQGQVVQQNRVELAPISVPAVRYLRLRWHDPASAPNLGRVSVRLSAAPYFPAAIVWTEPQLPAEGGDRDFQFTAPAAMPIERLRINLPRAGVMAPARIYAYDPAQAAAGSATTANAAPGAAGDVSPASGNRASGGAEPWMLRAHVVSYRMQAGVGEIVSPDVLLDGAPMTRFRVILDATQPLGGSPSVQIGFSPRALVFSATAPGPYTLAWGAGSVSDAAEPLPVLLPGQTAANLFASAPTLYADRREPAAGLMMAERESTVTDAQDSAASSGHRFGAWLTILLAVVDTMLAAMVWSAYRRTRRPIGPERID